MRSAWTSGHNGSRTQRRKCKTKERFRTGVRGACLWQLRGIPTTGVSA
jgi:hypothetical protein